MPTFLEVRPTVHASIKTTAVRLDDDFKVTIRQEEPRKNPTHIQRNYTGLQEGAQISGDDVETPVEYVRVSKLDDDSRCIIAVDVYHAADEADTVPAAGLYWYNTKTHSPFGQVAEPGKQVAPDPAYPGSATQTFPQEIFNISSATELRDHPIPTGNTVAVSFTSQRLYTRLGSLAERREHIKQNLRNYIEDPALVLWAMGSISGPASGAFNAVLNMRQIQSFSWWIEMMTRAISIDDNLNSERKFNLLDGESTLQPELLMPRISGFLDGTAPYTSNRSAWNFRRFGTVEATAPFGYTAPLTSATSWVATADTLITLTGMNVGTHWLTYLRS